MTSETNLKEAVLDRFFYLLSTREDFPPQILERLQKIRDEKSLHSSAEILAALTEGMPQDGRVAHPCFPRVRLSQLVVFVRIVGICCALAATPSIRSL